MSDDHQTLLKALEFHGHRCWASVAGVRAGLAALRVLNVKRSGGRQLHAFIEIGDDHGGICFGDGVQYATGCTLGKGNMEKTPSSNAPATAPCG
jgi:formylmethanofuran dehydrogenase subunit E